MGLAPQLAFMVNTRLLNVDNATTKERVILKTRCKLKPCLWHEQTVLCFVVY